MSALDRHILMWERRLLRFGRTDRADYIVHRLNLLRRQRAKVGRTSPNTRQENDRG